MILLNNILTIHPGFSNVIVSQKPYKRLDFSKTNTEIVRRDFSETRVFSAYVFEEMLSGNTFIGIGGYMENRVIYRKLEHFSQQEGNPRCIHLGTDIWTEAGTAVYTPLDGNVHSFAFNNKDGDYGPVIILKHELNGSAFYTLYGHLSLESLEGLYEGKRFVAGEQLAEIGDYPINGNWPPHLHFQVITDIMDYKGDFPGVCSIQDQEQYGPFALTLI